MNIRFFICVKLDIKNRPHHSQKKVLDIDLKEIFLTRHY